MYVRRSRSDNDVDAHEEYAAALMETSAGCEAIANVIDWTQSTLQCTTRRQLICDRRSHAEPASQQASTQRRASRTDGRTDGRPTGRRLTDTAAVQQLQATGFSVVTPTAAAAAAAVAAVANLRYSRTPAVTTDRLQEILYAPGETVVS